ncbi:MAG: stage V sporulation protein AE [Firmicutes bacterium]|nr:stage V sporulation protein AE [Bacillota bacterium]
MSDKRKIILVTDGDEVARRTVELAARNIGARCISQSAGQPSPLMGEQLVHLIKMAPHDPVVVMCDDCGKAGQGRGEEVLAYLANHPDLEVLGVLAVASNTEQAQGLEVQQSLACNGQLVSGPVDKYGYPPLSDHARLIGDTVEVLNKLKIKNVLGIGDIGKMEAADEPAAGAPITTRALQEILARSGYTHGQAH